jgi:hypothetical protein
MNKKFVAIFLAVGLLLSIGCVLSYNPSSGGSGDLSGQGDLPVLGDWTGQWDMVANTNYNFILDLQQSGNQITGTMTSKDMASPPVEIISGTISDGTIKFTRELAGQQKQVYTGTVSGSTITGTFDQNGQGQYPWSATKVQGSSAVKTTGEVSGAVKMAVEVEAGKTGTATLPATLPDASKMEEIGEAILDSKNDTPIFDEYRIVQFPSSGDDSEDIAARIDCYSGGKLKGMIIFTVGNNKISQCGSTGTTPTTIRYPYSRFNDILAILEGNAKVHLHCEGPFQYILAIIKK